MTEQFSVFGVDISALFDSVLTLIDCRSTLSIKLVLICVKLNCDKIVKSLCARSDDKFESIPMFKIFMAGANFRVSQKS